eukprot:scaffold16009_cov112-Skeletonema_marinoi.AAC.2
MPTALAKRFKKSSTVFLISVSTACTPRGLPSGVNIMRNEITNLERAGTMKLMSHDVVDAAKEIVDINDNH